MGSIQKSKNKTKKSKASYKGLAPLYSDRLLLWILKTIFQIPIFIMFYVFFISQVNVDDTLLEKLIEVCYIFVFLIVSDIIAYIIATGLDKYLIHRWGYLTRDRNGRHVIAFLTEYLIYIALRTISYAIGLIWILTRQFYFSLPSPWADYGFFFAWVIVSLSSKLIAMFTSFIILS